MNKRKLRVAWSSNWEFAPSGYGMQTADIKQRFLSSGWDASNFALFNMHGQASGKMEDKDGITQYPLMAHAGGSDALVWHAKDFKPDVVFGLFDLWVQNPQDLAQIPSRFIPWVPIDYDPVPKAILGNLRLANRIISMSKFGQKQLAENGFSSTFIPHGVDTNIFKPLSPQEKMNIKQMMYQGVGANPKTFIWGMVAANKEFVNPRKSFQQVMDAFKMFLQKKPDSRLYVHTNPDFPGGFLLKQYADFIGITPYVVYPDPYMLQFNTPKEKMNAIFNSFDCLLAPSSTEGFCIPVIEAQAAGIPVITHDWTAMSELVEDGINGYKVKTLNKVFYPVGSYIAFPDPDDLYQKMIKMTDMKTEVLGAAGRKFVEKNYSWDVLWKEKWLPFLDKLENEAYPTPQLTIPSTAV